MAQRYTINGHGNPVPDNEGMWVTYEAYMLKERQLREALKRLDHYRNNGIKYDYIPR